MAMKSMSAPRRLYVRAGSPVCCVAGCYFGPSRGKTEIDADKPVRFTVLKRDHGKARISVTQGEKSETWPEQHLTFVSRG
jgi:hypothetical protein